MAGRCQVALPASRARSPCLAHCPQGDLAHCPQGCAPFWLLLTGPLLRLFHFRTLLVSRCFQKEAQTPDRGLTLGTGWGPSLPWSQKTLTSSRTGQHTRSRLHLQPLFLCRD